MANSLNINRAHIVLVLCLPAAILIGYLLADPMQFSNMGLIALFFGVLSLPLLMKWYHFLLIFSCNAVFQFQFLPGSPPLWLIIAMAGLSIAILNRCVDSNRRLMVGGSIPRSLLLLGVVVFITAYMRGGAGLAALGGSSYGGRRYIYIVGAIAMYFAMVSQPISAKKRKFYAILFFVTSATSFLTMLVDYWGGRFGFLNAIVSSNFSGDEPVEASSLRFVSLGGICNAGLFLLLLQYGARGILSRYWRGALTALFFLGILLTGFRSGFGYMGMIFALSFFLEGLHRTKYMMVAGVIGLLFLTSAFVFSDRLPWQMQRAISFLPVRVSPLVKEDAQSSVDWRVKMWEVVIHQVPQYLWEGKGFALDPGDMYMSQVNSFTRLAADSSEWAAYAGDYHSGPLSLIIPLGIWGVLAFAWFLIVTGKMLYYNFMHGDPDLKNINTVFLGYFIAKVFFFVFLVGGFYSDLVAFTAIAGLSVSINGEVIRHPTREISPVFTLATQRIAKDL